jgi:hypothetical protein
MVGSRPSSVDLMAQEARVRSAPLHSTTGELAMAGGETVTAAIARMALWTSPIETKCTGRIYRTL